MVQAYEDVKERGRQRSADLSRTGRDIGDIPDVANPARRRKAARQLEYFCSTYFPHTFTLAWSDDHRKVIGYMEKATREGGLFAVAMPRGSGKTSLAEAAALWAILNGYRAFVFLIGASRGHAVDMLDSIKMECETNDLLAEDYPEALVPAQKLEGRSARCKGQLYGGERTYIEWRADTIVLPSLSPEGWADDRVHRKFVRKDGTSLSGGAIIRVAGLEGRIRGAKFKRFDGLTARPDLVIPDDPQTDESARSHDQCTTRELTLVGAVLGLAGPNVKISGIMPCTVIRKGDLADVFLDRKRHPEWNGVRTKMVYSMPSNMLEWEKYAELRADGLRAGDGGSAATEFYRQNRAAMDEGAVVAWEARKHHDEVSATQNAMNLFFENPTAFWAEYQNEPLEAAVSGSADLTADQIASKFNRIPRGAAPLAATRLTAFIDVQGELLYWLVAAWGDDFTGSVIDYGTFPDQKIDRFTLETAPNTLSRRFPEGGLEARLHAGLEALTEQLCGRAWRREGGQEMRIERLLIDANWGESTDLVYLFARNCRHAGIVTPSHGKFIGASSNPLNAMARKPGDRVGLNWRIPVVVRRAIPHVVYDTNAWKTFVAARLATPTGDKGYLSLFGDNAHHHRMLSEHLVSEYRVPVEGRGRKVDEWKVRPERPENHWLDCLVGAAVAASIQGAALMGQAAGQPPKPRERISFAELQRRARR